MELMIKKQSYFFHLLACFSRLYVLYTFVLGQVYDKQRNEISVVWWLYDRAFPV